MSFFLVDDQATFWPKVLDAGNAAFGVWVRLGAYSNAHLTDGFIPESIGRMVATRRELARMVKAGLAHEVAGGWQLDEMQHQKSRAESIEKRSELSRKRAEAGRIGGYVRAANMAQLQLPDWQPPSNLPAPLPDGDLAHTSPPLSDPDQDPDQGSHSPGPLPALPAPAAMRLDRERMRALWQDKTGLTGIVVPGLEDAATLVETVIRERRLDVDALAFVAQALDVFVRYCATRSPGYRPSPTGYKFVEHWGKVEPVLLAGGHIDVAPAKPGAGPTIVARLDFGKRRT